MKNNLVIEKNPYMSNRNLLTVAVLSGIGGVMSTYIGYLANLFNSMLGVPFGAGQFLSGLHVFWIILAAGLAKKTGAATLAGLIKGSIEFLTGGSHGIAIIIVSLAQGVMVDLILAIFRRHTLAPLSLAGGLAAASNVLVFQSLYFSGVAWGYIALITFLAFVSGVIFAGFFGWHILNLISRARVFRQGDQGSNLPGPAKAGILKTALIGLICLLFAGGAVYYFAKVYTPPWSGPECAVQGAVERDLYFRLSDFSGREVTIRAELRGLYTHVDEKEYTGIPVAAILAEAAPRAGSSVLKVSGGDGYTIEFELEKALADDRFILTEEEGALRLVAANYEGGCWVRQVKALVVE